MSDYDDAIAALKAEFAKRTTEEVQWMHDIFPARAVPIAVVRRRS